MTINVGPDESAIKKSGTIPSLDQVTESFGNTDNKVGFGGPFVFFDASGITDWSTWEVEGCIRRIGNTLEKYTNGLWVPFAGGGGAIEWLDEGVSQGTFAKVNLIGPDIFGIPDGVDLTQFNIFVPTPTFQSHWNTADGASGNQAVGESISRVVARISTPSGGEGSPFYTNGWSATNRDASLGSTVIFTTGGQCTGFGGDSTMFVEVFNADGVSLMDSYTTPAITGDGINVSPSSDIVVTISLYAPDGLRFQAHASVAVDMGGIFSNATLEGGRYHVRITHITDSGSDGTGPYIYSQSDVFLDTNPTTPAINGAVSIAETVGSILTKHLSGVEHYILNSEFTAGALDIDDLNENTIKIAGNLVWNGAEYGLPTLSHSPFGTGSGYFTGWTNDHDCVDVDYNITDWAITQSSYRYIGPTGNVSSYPADPWNNGATENTPNANILIDTYGVTSTAIAEYFDDEARREDPASFPGAGTWNSINTLGVAEAQIWNSRLIVPSSSTYVRSDGPNSPNANWTVFKPDLGGANPDYSALVAPVDYGRRFTQAPGSIPSFTIVFGGTFAAGDALADLIAGNLEIYVYRIAGSGHTGPPPGNTFPLRVHLPYNFGLWDDGVTIPGSGIREGSSAGNTINCTFGSGTSADTGFYCHVRILNSGTQIDSMSITFW